MSRFFAVLFLFCIALFASPLDFFAENDALVRHVRVGFFRFDGYHEIDDSGEKNGYGYDFLTLTRRYANVVFEYVGFDKTWKDMLKMLESGEIDLVTSAHKTPELERRFDFSAPIGTNSIRLNVRSNEARFESNNFKTYDGMLIGLVQGSDVNEKFTYYARRKGFSYVATYYDSEDDLKQALANGEVDAIATSSLRRSESEKTLSEFGAEYFYAIVKKGNRDLLSLVNYAIYQMDASEGDWRNVFAFKYFGRTDGKKLFFTKDEQAFIDAHQYESNKIVVVTDDNWAPFSELKDGQYVGIIPDYFSQIMKMTGMKYEFANTGRKVNDADKAGLKEGLGDIYLDYTGSVQDAESKGFLTSSPIMPVNAAFLSRRDRPEVKKIGVSRTNPFLNTRLKLAEGQEVVEFDDAGGAVDGVKMGAVDAAYLYAYDAIRLKNRDKSGILLYESIPGISVSVYAVVPDTSDHILLSIISKCVNQMDKSELENIVSNNLSVAVDDFTMRDWVIFNPEQFAAVIFLFAFFAVFLVGLQIRQRSRMKFEKINRKQDRIHREQMEIALKAAEHANQSKTTFLNSMSHDIRTPMNGIIGMTAIATSHLDDINKVKYCLSKITGASKHLLSLINDILDISRIESGKVSLTEENFNLVELIDNMTSMCTGQVEEKKQQLNVNTEEIRHENVTGDSMKLQQIFLNIVGNAIKYTPEGGKIDVRVREAEKFSTAFADYEFICSDTGYGMSPEFVEQIFEPFTRAEEQVKRGTQGTGLGMVISRNLARMMGGDIKVESELGKGSCFTISFSLKLQPETALDKKSAKGKKEKSLEERICSFAGKRILLVEDNELNREIATEILGTTEAQIETAENGEVAVNKFTAAAPGYYDLIFMDIQMPVMDGFAAARTIRASGREDAKAVPIVAMSASAFVEDVNASRDAGMNDHVAKPVVLEELMKVMKKYLNKESS